MSNMCVTLRPTVLDGKAERRTDCVYEAVCRLTAKQTAQQSYSQRSKFPRYCGPLDPRGAICLASMRESITVQVTLRNGPLCEDDND